MSAVGCVVTRLQHRSGFSTGLIVLGLIVLRACSFPSVTQGGDWPQILGPHRNGVSDGETLPASWPAGGPPLRWNYALGTGYSGPAVVGSRVVVFHRVGSSERVEALDLESGKSLWRADFPASYGGGYNADTGPRCVPLIHQGNVFVFGAAGNLHCVELQNGHPRWSRDVYREFEGDEGFFGAGSSPIIADNKLLVNVGGRRGAGLVAFAPDSGKTVWTATDEAASYSSPTHATIDEQDLVVFVTRFNALGINPANGEVRFRLPFGKRGPTVNAATPLVFDNALFLTASYGIGAQLATLDSRGAHPVWASNETMSSQYATAVQHNGYLYGTHGREDIGVAEFRCVDARTGTVKWSQPQFGVAHPILAGDKLLILGVEGKLVLAKASPTRFEVLAEAQVAKETTRALPALSQGQLLVRTSSDRGGRLLCLSAGGPPTR